MGKRAAPRKRIWVNHSRPQRNAQPLLKLIPNVMGVRLCGVVVTIDGGAAGVVVKPKLALQLHQIIIQIVTGILMNIELAKSFQSMSRLTKDAFTKVNI